MPFTLRIAGLWVLYAAWSIISGWSLSTFSMLGPWGYLATLPFGIAVAIAFWLSTAPKHRVKPRNCRRIVRLNKNPSKTAWILVALLVFIGACIHPPSNYDGLTYRLPRMLYWLQNHSWFWINSIDYRLDVGGVGFEWMSAPLFLLAGNDRLLFLLNFIPFLFCPGLFFIAARGLGISGRTARWWMFLWPLAFGITMQAGSIGNDFTAAALGLASLAFSASAGNYRPGLCLALSALAAALMTCVKVTSLPLGLPLGGFWLWKAWNTLPPLRIALLTAALSPVLILCSFLPLAFLSWKNTGAWNGNPDNIHGFEVRNPVAGLVGNSMIFAVGTVAPPVLPAATKFDSTLHRHLEPLKWFQWIKNEYPSFDIKFRQELPSEESSGIGLGISSVMLVWMLYSTRHRTTGTRAAAIVWFFTLALFVATLVFLGKGGGGGSTARLILPFTPFFLIAFIACFRGTLHNPGTLITLVPAVFLIPTLLLNPNRPLLPPACLSSVPGIPSGLRSRMTEVYEVYSRRNNLLEPLGRLIPPGADIGYAGEVDHSATALFRTHGDRNIFEFGPATENRVQWVVGTQAGIERRSGKSLESWSNGGFERVHQDQITSKISTGPETWFVFRKL